MKHVALRRKSSGPDQVSAMAYNAGEDLSRLLHPIVSSLRVEWNADEMLQIQRNFHGS